MGLLFCKIKLIIIEATFLKESPALTAGLLAGALTGKFLFDKAAQVGIIAAGTRLGTAHMSAGRVGTTLAKTPRAAGGALIGGTLLAGGTALAASAETAGGKALGMAAAAGGGAARQGGPPIRRSHRDWNRCHGSRAR